jgi:soluble lytic murein transglycosylase-like protein
MSTEALTGVATGMPAGELAIAERVRQLQSMIEQAGQISVSGVLSSSSDAASSASSASYSSPSSSTGDFSSALQAATTAAQTPIAYQAGTTPEASAAGSSQSGEYEGLIAQAAQRYGLDPAVLHGLIQQESGFDPSAQSSAGASGLTQLMPGTASSLGVANPLDPSESIEGGARYLSQLMTQFGGNTSEALAAYNAGPGAVTQYGGVPPYAETQSYVTKVLGYAENYRQAHPSAALAGVTA